MSRIPLSLIFPHFALHGHSTINHTQKSIPHNLLFYSVMQITRKKIIHTTFTYTACMLTSNILCIKKKPCRQVLPHKMYTSIKLKKKCIALHGCLQCNLRIKSNIPTHTWSYWFTLTRPAVTESESQSKSYCHITLQVMQVNCLIPHDSKCSKSVKEVRTWWRWYWSCVWLFSHVDEGEGWACSPGSPVSSVKGLDVTLLIVTTWQHPLTGSSVL